MNIIMSDSHNEIRTYIVINNQVSLVIKYNTIKQFETFIK